MTAKRRVKAGNGKTAATVKRDAFVKAYMANGHNATQAAITAGYSAKTAGSAGQRLLKYVETSGQLAEMAQEAGNAAGLSIERVLNEVRRLSFSDARRLLNADGTAKDPSNWDDDIAAAVSSLEVAEEFEGSGDDRKLSGYTKKLKLWDKNSALEKAMKHLGLYERDNAQRGDSLALQVVLVGAK